ncbi:MAG: helix-turn-helix transcriptional regulator [Bacilli bacterium]|nr:helix-turn-helix transcriptional regulator [Bacilli bacterium]
MELNERIKKYRKEAGLSQEDLASKIYVSRTLITKYESGSTFPTQENLEKIAIALNVKVEDLLSDREKNEIVEKSFKTNQRFWMILSICFASISVILLLLSVIPFYQYSSYDYSAVSYPDNPTPVHVTGYASIIGATLRAGNPISVINIVLLVCSIIISLLSFANLNSKALKIIRVVSIVVFVASAVLFFISFATMISIVGEPGFQMNIRN